LEDGLIDWATMYSIAEILSECGNIGIIPLPVKLRKPLQCLRKMSTLRHRLVGFPKWGATGKILASSLSHPDLDPGDKRQLAQLVKRSEERRWNLLDLAHKAWEFNATDLRDKIYALLGLPAFDQYCLGQARVR
jgi:hypothetical protein